MEDDIHAWEAYRRLDDQVVIKIEPNHFIRNAIMDNAGKLGNDLKMLWKEI